MKLINKEVYFEEFRLLYLPHILVYKMIGWDVFIFGAELNIKSRFYTHWLIRNNLITQVNAHFYPIGNSHSDALKLANKIIKKMKSNSNIKSMIQLYSNDEVLLVFKRSLVEKLVVLTSISEYLKNRITKNSSNDLNILLYPGQNYEYLIMLKKLGYNLDLPSEIKIIEDVRISRIVELIRRSGKYLTICILYLTHLFAQFVMVKIRNKRKKYRYCISVSSKFFEKFKGPRKYTFLINEEDITFDETIFLFEYQLAAEFIRKQQDEHINFFEFCSGKKNFLLSIFQKSTLQPKIEIKKLFSLILNFWQPSYIMNGVCCLLIQRLQWGVLTSKIQFDNYIFSNKEEMSQIAINIFLRSQNTTTWHYMQFMGGPYQIEGKYTLFDESNILWSYLNSDNFLLHHKAMYLSMSKHYQKVKNYIIIGNIFSEMINTTNKEDAVHKIYAKYNKTSESTKKKIISIFDTTYVNVQNIFSSYNEAQAFIRDLIKLARIKTDFLFVFKPSKTDDEFLDPNHIWSLLTLGNTVTNINEGKKIVALRKQFAVLPNTIMLDDITDPIEVIAASDVVITNGFSSPTADALSAGKPAFWYQSGSDVRGYPLDEIKGLVGHGFSELLEKFDDSFTPNFMQKLYSQPLYRERVNPFVDCQSLTRMRREICGLSQHVK